MSVLRRKVGFGLFWYGARCNGERKRRKSGGLLSFFEACWWLMLGFWGVRLLGG